MSRRNKKILSIFVTVILLCLLYVGFSYLSTNLDIVGSTGVRGATWNIHWDNVQVPSYGVEATTPSITSDTTVEYEITLAEPGDFFEFTVDAVNEGSLNAMIDSISTKMNGVEITTLPNYLIYQVSYSDGLPLARYQKLDAGDTETYIIRVEYKRDISLSDLVTTDTDLSFQFSVTYVQADQNAIEVPHPFSYNGVLLNYNEANGCATIPNDTSGGIGNAPASGLTLMMQQASLGEDQASWFTQTAETQGQSGVYMRAGTGNDTYPIYYFRGARTAVNNNLILGDYCWKIVRTTYTGGIRIIYNGPATSYQCFTQTGNNTIIGLYPYNYSYDDPKYMGYQYLNNNVLTDSNFKTVLENWYNTNLIAFDGAVEESLYCNDTTEMSTAAKEEFSLTTTDHYSCPYERARRGIPSVLCSRESDAYYAKVGFLTADEWALAGSSWNTGMTDYLANSKGYLLGSPYGFIDNYGSMYMDNSDRVNGNISLTNESGIRPVITLIPNLNYYGTGTTTDPFIVDLADYVPG